MFQYLNRFRMSRLTFALSLLLLLACVACQLQPNQQEAQQNTHQDPLPSWNEGSAKKAILDFVARTTTQGSPDFVPVDERIATFDNDGTLWVEQPIYTQFVFALDRVKALAPQHPDWKTKQPFKAVLAGDMQA